MVTNRNPKVVIKSNAKKRRHEKSQNEFKYQENTLRNCF